MQNLIRFIWKHHFTFLFLLLQLVAFTLVTQTNSFHNSKFISSTNAISGSLHESVSSVTQYLKLGKANDKLAKENALLRTQAKESFLPIKGYLYSIEDTLYRQRYTYTPAKVVNSTENRSNNFIILNKGTDHGIKPEMGVICSEGIVGIVRDVSSNYSSVFSVLHSKTKISAKLASNEYHGIIEWGGSSREYIELKNIPRHVELNKGEKVISRGGAAIFPAGIFIGTVEEFSTNPGSNFYDIKVKLSTDFGNLSHVYVVNNLLKYEQQQLEQTFEEEEGESDE